MTSPLKTEIGHDGRIYAGNQQCCKSGYLYHYFFPESFALLNIHQHTTQCVSVYVCACTHSGNLISGKLVKITLNLPLAHPCI